MRLLVLAMLVGCARSESAPPAPPQKRPIESDYAAPRDWPAAPAPTLPPELAIAWPPSIEDIAPHEVGTIAGGGIAYGVSIPSSFPRVFVHSDVDLLDLEAVWGKLVRDHTGSALWFNQAQRIRARFDAANPTPSRGRGLELAPYVSTIDRIANLDEIAIQVASDSFHIPPGEWDPAPVQVKRTGAQVRFTTRIDAAPVDEAAVLAKLREIYGEPVEMERTWTFAKGRVVARHVDLFPALEITYLAR